MSPEDSEQAIKEAAFTLLSLKAASSPRTGSEEELHKVVASILLSLKKNSQSSLHQKQINNYSNNKINLHNKEIVVVNNNNTKSPSQVNIFQQELTEIDERQEFELEDVDLAIVPLSNQENEYGMQQFKKKEYNFCTQCHLYVEEKYYFKKNGELYYLCTEKCLEEFKINNPATVSTTEILTVTNTNFVRKCSSCNKNVDNPEINVLWETMDFCNVFCLSMYQKKIGSICASCFNNVSPNLLGKYCVRFGSIICQFCTADCFQIYKEGVKICVYCQQNLSLSFIPQIFPLSNGSNQFCSEICAEKYYYPKNVNKTTCTICKNYRLNKIKFELNNIVYYFCGEPCFKVFSFVHEIEVNNCTSCQQFFLQDHLEKYAMYDDEIKQTFCSTSCQNIYIMKNRKIFSCSWCKVNKYNFDMIRFRSVSNVFCSVYCLNMCQVSFNALSNKIKVCEMCLRNLPSKYHIIMSDSVIRSFCSRECQRSFQQKMITNFVPEPPTFETNNSLINTKRKLGTKPLILQKSKQFKPNENNNSTTQQSKETVVKLQTVIKPQVLLNQRNVATMTRPKYLHKQVNTDQIETLNKDIQTQKEQLLFVPILTPIFVPAPLLSFTSVTTIPVPISIPIPIPIFIPITTNSVDGIMNKIKQAKSRIPQDPHQAELVSIADFIADDQSNKSGTDSTGTNLIEEGNNSADLEEILTSYEEDCQIEDNLVCHQLNDKNNSEQFLGVYAWNQWAMQKQLESNNSRNFKTNLLKLTTNELNLSLCSFITQIRKPNGDEYAPDTIFYLCLDIQQYLLENGRTKLIFYDQFFEKFSTTFNELSKKFTVSIQGDHYIVSRVEEEHLWKSQQLGAHSPQALLTTVIYFNTKYFKLSTFEEHSKLTFSRLLKQWTQNSKKFPNKKAFLCFYPPEITEDEKIYAQYENLENPGRCPVRLYEFYISKCTEGIKTKAVYYLEPEKFYTQDSPVWFSGTALSREDFEKIFNRIKMVKEINEVFIQNEEF